MRGQVPCPRLKMPGLLSSQATPFAIPRPGPLSSEGFSQAGSRSCGAGVEDSERHFDGTKSWSRGRSVRKAGFSAELGRPVVQRRPSVNELLCMWSGPGTSSGTGGSEDKLVTQKSTKRKMRRLFRL